MKKNLFSIAIAILSLAAISATVYISLRSGGEDGNTSPDSSANLKKQREKINIMDANVTQWNYEALVAIRDQKMDDPVADQKFSLKTGDVISLVPYGRQWSETERIIYLVIKLKISDEMAQNLTRPEEKLIPKTSLEGKDDTETVRARAYRLRIDELDFNPDEIRKGQPFDNKVFDESLVEKKKSP